MTFNPEKTNVKTIKDIVFELQRRKTALIFCLINFINEF